jgi:hypothetical protein
MLFNVMILFSIAVCRTDYSQTLFINSTSFFQLNNIYEVRANIFVNTQVTTEWVRTARGSWRRHHAISQVSSSLRMVLQRIRSQKVRVSTSYLWHNVRTKFEQFQPSPCLVMKFVPTGISCLGGRLV